jgi:hypothetical protein
MVAPFFTKDFFFFLATVCVCPPRQTSIFFFFAKALSLWSTPITASADAVAAPKPR